jgi:hypothetical protein
MTRASRRATRLMLAVVLAVAGCSGYRIVRDGAVQASAADKLKRKLVAIRGLAFKTPVPVVAVSAEDARGMLEREIRHDFEPGELATISRVYVALGLLPAGTDLEQAFLDLYSAQLAGFYDPVDRRMVLVNEALRTGGVTSADRECAPTRPRRRAGAGTRADPCAAGPALRARHRPRRGRRGRRAAREARGVRRRRDLGRIRRSARQAPSRDCGEPRPQARERRRADHARTIPTSRHSFARASCSSTWPA